MQNATTRELGADTYKYKNVCYKHMNIFGLSQYFINTYYFKKQKTSAFSCF